QKRDRVGGDRFTASYGVHTFVGLALDADPRAVDAKRGRETGAHGLDLILDLRAFQDDGDVQIPHLVALLVDHAGRLPQQRETVGILPPGVRVGKVAADVAQPGRAENRVGRGVASDVAVG